MKTRLKAPFFEVGVKNYIYGDDVLKLAQAADQAAVKFFWRLTWISEEFPRIRNGLSYLRRIWIPCGRAGEWRTFCRKRFMLQEPKEL